MVYVLHGEDVLASYQRLTGLLATRPKYQKIRLTTQNLEEDFYMATKSLDLFNSSRIVIAENLLNSGTLKVDNLSQIPKGQDVIFWEHSQLPKTILHRLEHTVKIELFKPKAQIFTFLDSLSPNPKRSLSLLQKLDDEKDGLLIWFITHRVLLLLQAKLGLSKDTAQKLSGRKIDDWQWQKIVNQSKLFDLETLKLLYSGILKLDAILKRGETDLAPRTLISILILKYLQK